MVLYRKHLEIYKPITKDNNDRRIKISFAVFSYLDDNGIEYRKKFTDKPNTPEVNFWQIAPIKIITNN